MGKHDIAVNKINSKEVGANIIAQDKLTYQEHYNAIDFDVDDLVNKQAVLDLISSTGITGSDKFYAATTALPITMVNGVDFVTTALRPIVNMTIEKDATTDTNNGSVGVLVDYNFTDATKTVLASITILDNGFGSLEFDSWFRVV